MNVEKIVDDLVAAINSRDAERVTNMFSEDCVFAELVGTGVVTHGRKETGALWAKFFKDVSKEQKNNKWDIHRKIISGNNAAVERTSNFIFKGKKIAVEMVAIIEIDAHGKVKVYKDYCDSRVFNEQTGNPNGGKEGW